MSPRRNQETLGERVKRLRIERGLSQRQLARDLHRVSYAYLSRIESDDRNPSVRAIRQLASALNVTPNYLEYGEEIDPEMRALLNQVDELRAQLTAEVDELQAQLTVEQERVAELETTVRVLRGMDA